jgi:hypothetical protein
MKRRGGLFALAIAFGFAYLAIGACTTFDGLSYDAGAAANAEGGDDRISSGGPVAFCKTDVGGATVLYCNDFDVPDAAFDVTVRVIDRGSVGETNASFSSPPNALRITQEPPSSPGAGTSLVVQRVREGGVVSEVDPLRISETLKVDQWTRVGFELSPAGNQQRLVASIGDGVVLDRVSDAGAPCTMSGEGTVFFALACLFPGSPPAEILLDDVRITSF